MRIRYLLLNAYGGGGTIRTTLSVASALAERGHDVEVASVVQRRPQPHFPFSQDVRLVSLTSPNHPVRGASRAAPPAHEEPAGPPQGPPVRDPHPGPRPVGQPLHQGAGGLRRRGYPDDAQPGPREAAHRPPGGGRPGTRSSGQGGQVRSAYAAHYPALDALAVLTEGDATAYRSLLGDSVPCFVMPNALAHGMSVRRAPLTGKVAVAAGALVPVKGFDLLIDAWRPIAAEHPDWRLRMYGGGEPTPPLPVGSLGPI